MSYSNSVLMIYKIENDFEGGLEYNLEDILRTVDETQGEIAGFERDKKKKNNTSQLQLFSSGG